jgi:hypothetical protein
MMFPDESVFREWAESPDYQRISEDPQAHRGVAGASPAEQCLNV